MYEFTTRVAYSEIDPDCYMTPVSVVQRMQDCSVFHSDSIGRGPDVWLRETGAWIIISWQIKFFEYPFFGAPVTTETRAYSFKGMRGYRNFRLFERTGDEEKLYAIANSEWVYFDFEKMRPIRVPEEESSGFGEDPKLDMEYKPRRIDIPTSGAVHKPPVPVTDTDIDTNHHMNNLRYIERAEVYLPNDAVVKELRVEYVRQARLGDRLCPDVYYGDGRVTVDLRSDEGEHFCIVEYLI